MSRPCGVYPFISDHRTGVYRILNLNTGAIYIGSAKSFYTRWRKHVNDLKKGQHSNTHLLRLWNKYGEASFKWEILELCGETELLQVEQRWLDWLYSTVATKLIVNTCRVAGSRLGVKMSLASKRKMSESAKKRGNTCPHDEDWRQKVSKANRENAKTRCGPEMRRKMGLTKIGNTHAKGLVWAHDGTRSYRVKPDDPRLLDGTLELGR